MNASALVRRLHQHRAWVNHKLVAAARQLPPDALVKSLPIGQGSIWRSLVHLFGAEFVWLEALEGRETALAKGDVAGKLPANQEAPDPIASLDELTRLWRDLDARWQAYLDGLTDSALDDAVPKVSSQGVRRVLRRSDILLHVCTHAHYTTAQVINMLRQLGVPALPDPMLITLVREETPPA
jgi:uncharacterized damage-inducible protein DinB